MLNKCWERKERRRQERLEGRASGQRGLVTDLEVISRQVALEEDKVAGGELGALRPQDKVLRRPCVQGLEEEEEGSLLMENHGAQGG